jgi:hypothetical protein
VEHAEYAVLAQQGTPVRCSERGDLPNDRRLALNVRVLFVAAKVPISAGLSQRHGTGAQPRIERPAIER